MITRARLHHAVHRADYRALRRFARVLSLRGALGSRELSLWFEAQRTRDRLERAERTAERLERYVEVPA